MQFSIKRLTLLFIVILTLVAGGTTVVSLWTLHSHLYLDLNRHDNENLKRVTQGANAIAHQLAFYQKILDTLASKPDVRNMLDFGEITETNRWSLNVRNILPGILGSALADPHGKVFGEPIELRVGPACESDLRMFSNGNAIEYPPIHNSRSGFEHFDILARAYDDEGAELGILFISFRFAELIQVLEHLAADNEQWELIDQSGKSFITHHAVDSPDPLVHETAIANTTWRIRLTTAANKNTNIYYEILILDAIILLIGGFFIALLLRFLLKLFRDDMTRIQYALNDVLHDRYEPSKNPAALMETHGLLQSIQEIAYRLQSEKEHLKRETLTDPLTQLNNRRYFNLMLEHEYSRSQRSTPTILVIVDLNKFKAVNDNLGHEVGDNLLIDIASFLKETIRDSDKIMRLGGDEFALFIYNMPTHHLAQWLKSLCARFDNHIKASTVVPKEFDCSLSLGASVIDASYYDNCGDIFNAADEAMYTAKQEGVAGESRYCLNLLGPVNKR